MKLNIVHFDSVEYPHSLEMQERLHGLRLKNLIDDTLLLLQHFPVITLGIRGSEGNILASKEALNTERIGVFRINRGGDVTYHCPGQLVGYLIFDLKNHRKSIKDFVWKIEESIIKFLKIEYNIIGVRGSKKYTGIWVGNEKITAIGLNVRQWVTTHGFSFNINPDLESFKLINPCGITDRGLTSLEKLAGRNLDFENESKRLSGYFAEVFGMTPASYEEKEFNEYLKRF